MLSLILAIHNGAETLPRTLDAFTRLAPLSDGLEIIAVDNASTDQTVDILESYMGRLPMTVLHEPRQGKSFALNKGIDHANGNFIVFTDDDIIPEVNWLTAYMDAAEHNASIGIFAGQVRHEWDAPPPHWLKYLASVGKSYGGTPSNMGQQIVSSGAVKGCNLMVRRSTLGQTRFAETSDVNFCGEGHSSGGEDTLFAKEIAARNLGILFVPDACVRHIVRTNEIGVKPVFSRYLRIGSTQPIEAKGGIAIMGYPAYGLRQAFSQAASCLSCSIRGKSEEAATHMVHLAKTLGSLRAGRRIKGSRRINSQAPNGNDQ